MRKFIIIMGILSVTLWFAGNVAADTLYGLYSDYSNNSTNKTTTKKQTKNKSNENYNNTYMPNFSSQNQIFKNPEELMKKGSQNYGEYSQYNKLTNPVRIGNPYNHLNEKYITSPKSATKYNGEAVRFKQGVNGTIYGYDKNGQKVGTYRLNNNGTTTEFNTKGKEIKTFK